MQRCASTVIFHKSLLPFCQVNKLVMIFFVFSALLRGFTEYFARYFSLIEWETLEIRVLYVFILKFKKFLRFLVSKSIFTRLFPDFLAFLELKCVKSGNLEIKLPKNQKLNEKKSIFDFPSLLKADFVL